MMLNASIPISQLRFKSPHFLFYRQLAWTGGSLLCFFTVLRLPLQFMSRKWFQVTMLTVTYLLLVTVFTQSPINGTRRWFHAGGISFQPSEVAKLVVLIFMSWYLSRVDDLKEKPLLHLARLALVLEPMLVLVMLEPDMGNTILIVLLIALYLYLADFPLNTWEWWRRPWCQYWWP